MTTEAATKNDINNPDLEAIESTQSSTPIRKSANDPWYWKYEPWYWKYGPLIALVGMLCAVVIPVGVCLGVDNDNCDRERYSVDLEINETSSVQEIQLTNLSSVYPGMISTYHFVVDDGRDVTSASYYAAGWFDTAISVEPPIGNRMSITTYHHNQMEVEKFVQYVIPRIEIASPIVCEPPTQSVKAHGITIGGESDIFDLGTCHIVRLDEPSLEPREFDIIHGTRLGGSIP